MSNRPIEDILEELAAEVPQEDWKKLPPDLTDNLDHYLYGSPKHSRSTMRVDIEEVERLQARRRAINKLPLAEIEWHENGVLIGVESRKIEEATLTGLLNTDFPGFYFGGSDDQD